jgi:hypothetical protein
MGGLVLAEPTPKTPSPERGMGRKKLGLHAGTAQEPLEESVGGLAFPLKRE